MNASRKYNRVSSSSVETLLIRGEKRINKKDEDSAEISPNAKEMSQDLRKKLRALSSPTQENSPFSGLNTDLGEEPTLRMIRQILKAFGVDIKEVPKPSKDSTPQQNNDIHGMVASISAANDDSEPFIAGDNTWTRSVHISNFVAETENTFFSTTGLVKTEDGREIAFNVDVEMSRSFMSSTEIYYKQKTSIPMIDPLVVNLAPGVTSISDQKFFFDLDSDGTEEELNELSAGSAFLALDKNGDGEINNGKELFGTQTGDGFAELAAYDDDKNGWIDENDDIFKKLRLYTKDSNGNTKLIDLSESGIGAIHLGSASTEFSLNESLTNKTNAQIRKTGIYLKENGSAGTIQHVDFAL